ncbi:MAG: D-alanyl-D-alanine carboxypeptidase/D-alanyl-D-alanine endopeptidase [Acidimicrobiales bacterium]
MRPAWRPWAALSLVGAAVFAVPARVATPTPPLPVTPVLSMRRIPGLVGLAVATSTLDDGLDAALGNTQWEKSPSGACLVVQTGTDTLYSHNPALALLPASNLKLLTATAALDKLAADDRLTTAVDSDGPPAAGTVNGNLYPVGGGDPLLDSQAYADTQPYSAEPYDDLAKLAAQVRAAGVTAVSGSVVGDESRYDTQRTVASWAPSYLSDDEVGPLSALMVSDGFITPPPPPTTTTTMPPATTPTTMPTPTTTPKTTPTTTPKTTPTTTPHLVAAAQPAQAAAEAFTAALGAAGVTVAGPPAVGTTPVAATHLTSLQSPPLPQVLGVILRRSDNTGAELVTKELGHQAGGAGTTAAGVSAIEADLQADGLATTGLTMVDGSGLSRDDRATCQLLLAALDRGGPNGALGQDLPVAAKSGTLVSRFGGTPAAGRLRAKTGSLDGVSSLSGFVTPASSSSSAGALGAQGVAFSLITNAIPSDSAGEALTDRIGLLLAQFPEMPPLSQLGPQGRS